MRRRTFIKYAGTLTSALGLAPISLIGAQAERKFRVSLNPGAIGVTCTQKELVNCASRHQFEAISPLPDQLMAMASGELNEFLAQMKANKLTWDAAGLPVDFRKDPETFREGLSNLPKVANACQAAGVTRMSTWIMPSHNELTYTQNFNQHRDRLRQIAEILQDYDIRFGLEYVGTKRLKTINRYPFAGTMKEMLELIQAINIAGMGLQLDAYHWYTSTETVADLLALKNEQVITCDLNDAKSGRTIEEQVDGERELPGDSGLIDLKGFMQALVKIGYDGAVRAEPFNAKLNAMENEEALATTSRAMWRTVRLVDPT